MNKEVNMDLKEESAQTRGIRVSVSEEGHEIGRAYLYIMENGLHSEPFGLLEDVFVAPEARGRGVGNAILARVLAIARNARCYKLIATSRFSRTEVHAWYERLGFELHGKEFRLNLKN